MRTTTLVIATLFIVSSSFCVNATTPSNEFVRGVLTGMERNSNIQLNSIADSANFDLFYSAITNIEHNQYAQATEKMNHFFTVLMMDYKNEVSKREIFEIILSADQVFVNKNYFSQLANSTAFSTRCMPLLQSSQQFLLSGNIQESGRFFGQFIKSAINLNQRPNFRISKALIGQSSPYDEFVQDVFRGLYDGLGYTKNENIFKLINIDNFNINDFITSLNTLSSSSYETMKTGSKLMNSTFAKTEQTFQKTVNSDQNFLNLFETLRLSFAVTTFFVYRLDTYRIRTNFDPHYSLILASDSTDMGQYYSAGLYLARCVKQLQTLTHVEDYNWPVRV